MIGVLVQALRGGRNLGLSATEIGNRIHASAEVVNRLLLEKGLIGGEPGAYFLTEAAEAFGAAVEKDNGYGGWAYREWGWNTWDESVLGELGATPEKIAEMTMALRAARAAKRTADKIASEQYWAEVMAKQADKLADLSDSDSGLSTGQKVAIAASVTAVVVVGVVGGVVIYKVVQRRRQRKIERVARHANEV
jgi:hypothetical protein